jgi:hypothetical protein
VNVLVSSPDHIGTSVPLMAVWLIVDRARPRWYVPVITSLLLTLALVADSLVLVAGIVPVVLVCGTRVLRSAVVQPLQRPRPRQSAALGERLAGQWYDIALGGGAVAAAVIGMAVPRLIQAAGGYTQNPLRTQFSPIATVVGHNLAITGQSLLLLPGADFLGLRAGASTFFVMLHLVGVALAACGIAVGLWHFPRATDRVNQLLVAGIMVTVVAFAVGTHAQNLPSAREIAPVLPFAAALAGRELARPLVSARLSHVTLPVLGAVLAGYLAGLGLTISRPAAPPQAQQLTTWLEHHDLGTGLSGFWEANVVTLTSGGRVAVRLVRDDAPSGLITRGSNDVQAAWYDPAKSSASFVVLFPGIDSYPGFTGLKQAVATFGKPARIYHVGSYAILYWPKNLLAELPG